MTRPLAITVSGFFAMFASLHAADPAPGAAASGQTAEAPSESPSPTPAANLAPLPNPADIPSTQAAAEASILPGEPVLDLPDPSVLPNGPALDGVQPLPTDQNIRFDSKLVEENKRKAAFRAARTRTVLQPEIESLKKQAFAAKTEREKRALLRQYYAARAKAMQTGQPAYADDVTEWSVIRAFMLSRPRTEPETAITAEIGEEKIKRFRLDREEER